MNRTFGSLVLAIVGALTLFGLRYYFHAQQERQAMDDFVSARLQNMHVPLDCPPFGQQQVFFDTEYSKSDEVTEESMTQIVKNWSTLWSVAYPAIDQKAKDYNARDHLAEKLEITVVLPDSSLSNQSKWDIEASSVGGIFSAQFAGMKFSSSSADF